MRAALAVGADLLRVAVDAIEDREEHVGRPVGVGALAAVLDELDDAEGRAELRLKVKVDLRKREGEGRVSDCAAGAGARRTAGGRDTPR